MPRSRGRTFVRWLLILLVLGLAATAVALVVLGDTQKQLRIGVLLGVWAAVVAYFLPPARREEPPEAPVGHDVVRPAYNQVGIRTEPDPRRDYEVQLQRTFRAEMERALNEQVARLSSEVASLRNDLVEKVNGQLRLERTETTRVIGSDIEALQREIRRLAVSREFLTPVPSLPPTRETLTVAAVVAQASASERPMGAQLTTPLPAPPSSLPPLRAASTTPPPRPPLPTPPPRVAPPTSSSPVPPPAPPRAPEPAVSRPAPAPSPSRVSPLPPTPAVSLPKPAVSIPAAPPVAASAAPRVTPSSRPVTLPQTMPPAASSLPTRPPAGPPPATVTRATPPQATPRPATLPPLTRPATPISPVTPPATPISPVTPPAAPISAVTPPAAWTPPAAPATPATGSRPNGFSAEFGTTSAPPLTPRPSATRSEPPAGSRPSMGGEWSSASQWSATRPAGNGAQPSVQPYSAPDPFGEMPRLGVFRDLHDGDIVQALPEGYVGRRRAVPSHQAGVRSGM